ncbi:MAG: Gfo/Idh/MocA family oxidoreductase [Anaerolineae bacterium]|nr:Gfo/Idh/MocA family oxidoreductase [Anaerolineae bacterium]
MTKSSFGWGILGAGRIAARFATDLKKLPQAKLVAVGSRALDKAQAFADEYGFDRAYSSYADMLADPAVDVVYVATPHPFHREHTLLCIDAGKAVLCEKPIEINAGRVIDMVRAARGKGVFLMEAMWTRFLPVIVQVQQWLTEGRIGEVRMLNVDFGFRSGWDPEGRLLNPALAGGALLDVGVYVTAFASMVFGAPESVRASAHLGETGVDEQTAMVLKYAGGQLALLSCAVRTNTPQQAFIQGADGAIHVPDFWHAITATLKVNGQEPVEASGEAGYQFEAAEAMACLAAGKTESDVIPLDESIAIAQTLQEARRQIGLKYPME